VAVRSSTVMAGATLAFVLACARNALAEDSVAVLTASPASEDAARYLSNQTDLAVVRRTSSNARNLDALLEEARTDWREPLVVVIDADRRVVSVLRPQDGTISSRTLAPSAAAAPYVVAVAAAELLDLVQHAPTATATQAEPPSPGTAARLALQLGVMQTVAVNGQIGLLQPTVGADVAFARRASPLWFGVGLHATGLSPMRRRQVLSLGSGADPGGTIKYERNELALRVLVSHRQGHVAATAWGDLGFAFVRASALDSASNVVADDSRQALWLGLGAEFRYSLFAGVSLGLAIGGAWFPVTSQFYASPAGDPAIPAFEESAFDLRACASLGWETNL
jgi:hypothetical protein